MGRHEPTVTHSEPTVAYSKPGVTYSEPTVIHSLAKRAIDVIGAAVALVATAPVMVVIAVHAAIAYRTSPLFFQRRVGLHQNSFRMVKVRTLPPETPRYTKKYDLDPAAIGRGSRRVRLLHLDELPQLALVLIGKMSLVGPRPEMRLLHEALPPVYAATRTSVRPGCTGLWQISADAKGLIGESPEYDAFYVANHTIRLDLWILFQTARTMMFGTAVQLSDVPAWALPRDRAVRWTAHVAASKQVSPMSSVAGERLPVDSARAS